MAVTSCQIKIIEGKADCAALLDCCPPLGGRLTAPMCSFGWLWPTIGTKRRASYRRWDSILFLNNPSNFIKHRYEHMCGLMFSLFGGSKYKLAAVESIELIGWYTTISCSKRNFRASNIATKLVFWFFIVYTLKSALRSSLTLSRHLPSTIQQLDALTSRHLPTTIQQLDGLTWSIDIWWRHITYT